MPKGISIFQMSAINERNSADLACPVAILLVSLFAPSMKTPLLKSNLLIKPSIVLAAAVLTAAFLLVPFARAATDPLMPRELAACSL